MRRGTTAYQPRAEGEELGVLTDRATAADRAGAAIDDLLERTYDNALDERTLGR
jgi:hypothetical protein